MENTAIVVLWVLDVVLGTHTAGHTHGVAEGSDFVELTGGVVLRAVGLAGGSTGVEDLVLTTTGVGVKLLQRGCVGEMKG